MTLLKVTNYIALLFSIPVKSLKHQEQIVSPLKTMMGYRDMTGYYQIWRVTNTKSCLPISTNVIKKVVSPSGTKFTIRHAIPAMYM